MPDWIEDFLEVTDSIRSPYSFRLWTAITTVAAALERRIWTITDVKPLYPNLYTILGGLPASGKTIMTTLSKEMLDSLKGIHFGPDNPTKESFMEAIGNSAKPSINGMGVPMYSALYAISGEFGDLMSKYDSGFAAALSTMYDNPMSWSSPRKSTTDIFLEAPTLNILGAVTPSALNDIIPETAWGQGFTSRVMFVYGAAPDQVRQIFKKRREADLTALKKRLEPIFYEHHGETEWELSAQEAMEHWFNVEKMIPVPTYGRLVNYAGRRDTHVMKLSMVSCVSAGRWPIVTLTDFLRARKWLLDAEKVMPDIFRAMIQKSDSQILQDLHYFMYTTYMKVSREKRQPISERDIYRFLENKTTSDKMPKIIQAAERAGYIRRGPGFGLWIPNSLEPGGIQIVDPDTEIELPNQPENPQ